MKRILLIFLVCMVCFSLYPDKKSSYPSPGDLTGSENKKMNKSEKIDSNFPDNNESMANKKKSPWPVVDQLENRVKNLEETIRYMSGTLHFYRYGFAFLIIAFFVLLSILLLFLSALYKCNKKISGLQQRLSNLQKGLMRTAGRSDK